LPARSSKRSGQGQSDAAGDRPPRRWLSRSRKPGRFCRLRRSLEAFAGRRTCARGARSRCRGCRGGADNLVIKAANALGTLVPGLAFGRFRLDKQLPVAAGLGGGSADAAATLRLLARANGFAMDDPRLHEAARATGADVPVCLDPRPRVMRALVTPVGAVRTAGAAGPACQSQGCGGYQGGLCQVDAGRHIPARR